MLKSFLRFLVWMALAALPLHAISQDAALDRARQLIEAKQFKEAFALLDPLESERAGEPNFDYLLGLAAIDAGHLTRAVFALERVLASRPDDPRARAEIARAYFLMGEGENARREFAAVKAAKPPPEVAATIDRFLDTLDIRGNRPPSDREGFTGFAEFTVGHDSNANSATSSGSFPVPLFPGADFILAPGATKLPDYYRGISAGINGRKFLTGTLTLFGTASIDRRMNESFERFDTDSLSASLGLSMERDADEFTFAAQLQSFEVDDRRFRSATGGIAQWRRNLNPYDQLTGYAQRTRLHYPGQTQRDSDRTALGGAWAHAFDALSAPVFFASAYAGTEDQRDSAFPEFGHRFVGGRLGGQVDLAKGLRFTANLTYEDRRYGGPDPLFLVKRHDKETGLRFSLPWEFEKNWTLTPQLSFTENRSNVIVSEYSRNMVFITLRHEFR